MNLWERMKMFGDMGNGSQKPPEFEGESGEPQDEVVAKQFLLKDDAGNVRGVFGVDNAGPNIRLYREDGQPRAWMYGGGPTGASLTLCDDAGQGRIMLSVLQDGTPVATLRDSNGKVVIWAMHTATGAMVAIGLNGQARVACSVDQNGYGSIEAVSASGAAGNSFAVNPDGTIKFNQ